MSDFFRVSLMLLAVAGFFLSYYLLWHLLGYLGMSILGILLSVAIILLAMKYIRPRS